MAIIDRLLHLSTLAVKFPVRVATTAPITLSGLQTIDGVTVASGDRVLVKDQSSGAENGIYGAKSGTWFRAQDFNDNSDFVQFTRIYVGEGATQARTEWLLTTSNPSLGTSDLTFAQAAIAGVTISAYMATLLDDTSARTARATLGIGFLTPEDFGAVGDGTTNDAAAFQAAIDALPSGGVIQLGRKRYRIDTGLVANAAVLLMGDTLNDITSETAGSGLTKPQMFWGGAGAGTMFTIEPATTGNVVFGGGSLHIEWHGNHVAATAVHLNNTRYARFDGKVTRVVTAGVVVSSDKGSVSAFSMKNHIQSLEFIWGTAVAAQNAHGLVLRGNGSTVPATQQLLGDIFGLVYNGSLVSVAETDSLQALSVHGVVQSGGTGRAIDLLAGGAQNSDDNMFLYVTGPIRLGNGLAGNRFLHYVTETGGISQSSGSSQWGGTLVDYATGEMFVPRQYALRDRLSIASGQIMGGASTTTGDFAAQWTGTILAESLTRSCSVVIPAPYNFHAGVIESVQVLVGSDGTSAGNYRVRLRASTFNNVNAAGPEADMTQTSAAGAQFTLTTITFDLSPDLAFAKDNNILLRFTREGADAADTNTDDMYVLGMRVNYKSSGPPTDGYTWAIPNYT
jgi:hypothetical protein